MLKNLTFNSSCAPGALLNYLEIGLILQQLGINFVVMTVTRVNFAKKNVKIRVVGGTNYVGHFQPSTNRGFTAISDNDKPLAFRKIYSSI